MRWQGRMAGDVAATRAMVVRAQTLLEQIPLARSYKRDKKGKFSSGGGGGGRNADFDARAAAARSGQDALDAAPIGYGHETTGLTPPQGEAIRTYMGLWGCQRINGGLRSGDMSAQTHEEVRHIDEAMDSSRLSSDVVIHRGLRDADALFGDRLGGDLTGATWTEASYVSTSPRASFATNWAREGSGVQDPSRRPIAMRILAPKGTPAIAASDAELLLGRGLTLRVAADHGMIDGVRHVDLEVAP